MGNIFLSYARADDEPFVKQLYQDLTKNGIDVWWDRKAMESRGRSFLQELRDAIEDSDRLIAVIGPKAVTSDYVNVEWKHALLFAKGVVPILRCGDYDLVPSILSKFHCLDFRKERTYQDALAELQRILKEPVPKLGRFLTAVPSLPPQFLPRLDEIARLGENVLADIQRPTVITSAEQTTALQGMGGVGKSVLASAFARATDTRRAFDNGIVWITIGQRSDPLMNMKLLGLAFDDNPGNYTDLEIARNSLPKLLADKVCLIILDDIWNLADVIPFKYALGPRCRLLITTRDGGLITALGAKAHRLDVLNDVQAQVLLAQWADQPVDTLPPEARAVAGECGNLPLALAIVGAMVRGKPNRWDNILHKLRNADLDKIKQQFPNYPYPDILKAIQVSIEALEPEVQKRYLDFSVFPEKAPISEVVLQTFWEPEGLDEYDIQDIADILVDKSLAQRDQAGFLMLHDLQLDYVRKQVEDLPALHNRLLEAYRLICTDGWSTGPNDGYFFEHLAYHLVEAGHKEELHKLLLDFNWMQASLESTDVNSLVTEYDYFPEDPNICLVQSAIRLSAHVLTQDKTQLASQILGRLQSFKESELQSMLKQARKWKNGIWLRPLTASLMPPGSKLIHILGEHNDEINSVLVTPDGRKAIFVSRNIYSKDYPAEDYTLKIWDIETGKQLGTQKCNINSIYDAVVSPDGQRLISISNPFGGDDTLKVWDIGKGELIQTLKGHTGLVIAVVVTSDGKRAISASIDNTIRVWEIETGVELKKIRYRVSRSNAFFASHFGSPIKGHTDSVNAIAAMPDDHLITASDDKTLIIWDIKKRSIQCTLHGHTDRVNAVTVLPDDGRVISASADNTLKIWDTETGEELHTLKGHNHWVHAVAVTPDGRRAISASSDATLKVWDLESGEILHTIEVIDFIKTLVVTPDGQKAILVLSNKTLKIWDIEKGDEQPKIEGHSKRISAVAVSPDGSNAVSASWDNSLKLWNTETGDELKTLKGHSNPVLAVAITPDGRRVISASWDHTLKIWDIKTGELLNTLKGHTSLVNAIALTPDGQYVISASSDNNLIVWEIETGNQLYTLKGHTNWVDTVVVTPDGEHALSASGRIFPKTKSTLEDYSLRVWDLKTGKQLHNLEGHISSITGVVVTSDGRYIISASEYGNLIVWNMETGKLIKKIQGHISRINAVNIMPDDKHIISASTDSTMKVWNIKTGKQLCTMRGDNSPINTLILDKDLQRGISASSNGILIVWDMETAKSVASFIGDYSIETCAVSPDGKNIVAGDYSGRVHFLRLEGEQ